MGQGEGRVPGPLLLALPLSEVQSSWMEGLQVAGICSCSLAIFLGGLVIGLYIYFVKRVKTYLLISTLYVAVAVMLEAATNIASVVMGDRFGETSCFVNLTFKLIGQYFISFWCGSISIMFMVALHTVSMSSGNGVSRPEKVTFYVTLVSSAAASLVLPIVLISTNSFVYVDEEVLGSILSSRCFVGNRLKAIEDNYNVPVTERVSFYFLDIPEIVCMCLALVGIVYAFIISRLAKSRRYPNVSAPSKQYYIMLGSTLGLYVAGQTPMIVLNLSSLRDMMYNSDSINYSFFLPLINSFLPIPIWVCTIYAFSKISRDLRHMSAGSEQFVKLLEDGTSDELLYSSYSNNSYT